MKRGTGVAVLAALILVACPPLTAEAHESRTVADGNYELVVGFLDEPAFAGEKNGLSLRVSAYGATATPEAGEDGAAAAAGPAPVEGLEETLTAQVVYGDQTMDLALDAAYGDPGHYEAIFFPMEPGDYTFRIAGEIEGEALDESFTSSPNGFSPVQDPAPLRFPRADDAATATAGFMTGGAAGLPGLVLAAAGIAAAGLWRFDRRSGTRA